ncbi:MAG TPA: DGQHR domain-containing protein [Gemmatimonadales bacterium]|nr:DGQHR domain-containing protein [Gemmatimonadales bacterium]
MSSTRMLGHVEHRRVHVAVVTPPVARDLFFVSTYETTDPKSNAGDKHGYQRPPNESRFPEIARYFRENDHQFLITPLIVSVRLSDPADIDRFMALFEANDIPAIRRAFGEGVASVVDGQHRFRGLVHAWEQQSDFLPSIPVMLFFGLSFVDEAELFNTINVTQRKLPKALIETTKGDITEADSDKYAQRVRRISFSLCRDNDSVWGPVDGNPQVNMTGVRDPDKAVTYEGLRRSTSNMFPVELLERLEALDPELPIKLAKRYWRRVAETCREAWTGQPSSRTVLDEVTGEEHSVAIRYRIKDLVGVAALAKLGKDIITSQIESREANRLEDLVDKLVAVDWEKREGNPWMGSQAGFAGQKDLYHMLHRLVYTEERPEGVPAPAEVTEAA